METKKIKCLLMEQGIKMVDLEVANGLNRGVISLCLITPHEKGEKVLSKVLNIPANKLFPERYDNNGERLKPQPADNYHYMKRVHSKATFSKLCTLESKVLDKGTF